MAEYVIGDIHGEIEELEIILEKINYDSDQDKLIFVGDYIDRGANSYQVYKYIKKLNNGRNIFLRGNHEEMMIDAVLNENNVNLWYQNGGRKTEASFPNQTELKEAAHFFNSLPYYHADQKYIFVHAGINPALTLEEQTKHDLIWIRYKFLEAKKEDFKEERTIVAGHTPVAEVKFDGNKILVDTGSGKGGILSAVDLKTKKVYSTSNENPIASFLI
ncbi:serine/threonine protein phosphatase 1 [Halanaerobium congolense]|uniref:Serine/threonine protein phosphatase 1 n=1 Tax=Halanaerobium congolense TaxID=54121 RepID=A0A1I0AHQ5_9FIRM|nr:metallophosphoesterase family protein [Halanaerobium congolense]PTX17441.1 serine/threonine protein phosphatase 1 [Halanaerobium congolense]SDF44488.1 serine/threonine protein phosphatase 1 [Halanaerobium congolense]SES93814.1 serine/threonine protein phosphatase 1 [Halanaerobium congolense]SFP25059.1 serine/threonine protein phosphatase 1 [Halanaerobium congolense]